MDGELKSIESERASERIEVDLEDDQADCKLLREESSSNIIDGPRNRIVEEMGPGSLEETKTAIDVSLTR